MNVAHSSQVMTRAIGQALAKTLPPPLTLYRYLRRNVRRLNIPDHGLEFWFIDCSSGVLRSEPLAPALLLLRPAFVLRPYEEQIDADPNLYVSVTSSPFPVCVGPVSL